MEALSRGLMLIAAAAMSFASAAPYAHESSASSPARDAPFRGAVATAQQGRTLQILGERITVKVAPTATNGKYAVVEEVSPPGSGTPLHTHENEDEIFYVLEGEVQFQLGEEKRRVGPGATAVLPRGVSHAVRNVGSAPSKALVIIVPGRFMGFFEEIDELSRERQVTPADASRIGSAYGLTIHPPEAEQ